MSVAELPRLHDERAAARKLGVSVDTLRRERQRGRIGFVRIGQRKVKYTDRHLADYLELKECPVTSVTDSRSEVIGFPSAGTVGNGAGRGSMREPVRRDAHRSAQTILRKPSSA